MTDEAFQDQTQRYFFTLLASIFTDGSSILTENAEYFPIELPFPRDLPIKTTDEFGAYARRIYASLGLGAGA